MNSLLGYSKQMKRILIIILIALSLTALIIIFPLSCEYIEHPSRYLEYHNESLYGGGWVPKIFPNDIREIHEQHDIDTNGVWLRFRKGTTEFIPSLHGFVELQPDEVQKLKFRKPFLASWWFKNIDKSESNNVVKIYKSVYSQEYGAVTYIKEDGPLVYWWCQ